jgi:hypothetical protein
MRSLAFPFMTSSHASAIGNSLQMSSSFLEFGVAFWDSGVILSVEVARLFSAVASAAADIRATSFIVVGYNSNSVISCCGREYLSPSISAFSLS